MVSANVAVTTKLGSIGPVGSHTRHAAASATEQALSDRLMTEISTALSCRAGLISTGRDLAAAHARVKELEAKYEPKPADPVK